MSKAPPYIGVTGFMSPDEVQAIQDMIDPVSRRKLMVGVLVSDKTAHGQANKYPYKYPAINQVSRIFEVVDPNLAFGLIHFSSDNRDLWPECHLALQAIDIRNSSLRGDQLRGFQFNYVWPKPEMVVDVSHGFRREFYGYEPWHVLQLGPTVLEDSLIAIQEGVRRYRPLSIDTPPFSYLLIDMSGGRGEEPEWSHVATALQAMQEFVEVGYQLKIAVAGGLAADNLHKLRPLVDLYPDLSIDAESRLRADDGSLDIDRVKAYITAAYELFS